MKVPFRLSRMKVFVQLLFASGQVRSLVPPVVDMRADQTGGGVEDPHVLR